MTPAKETIARVARNVATAVRDAGAVAELEARLRGAPASRGMRAMYHECMTYYARQRDVRRSGEVFGAMRRAGVMPSTASYNILIGAYATLRDTRMAEDLLKRCPAPNVRTLAALPQGGSIADALRYAATLRRDHNVVPDVSTLTRWLALCHCVSDITSVVDMAHAEGSPVHVDAAFYRAVLTRYAAVDYWAGGRAVWRQLKVWGGDVCEATLVVLLNFIARAVGSGALTAADVREYVAFAEEVHRTADPLWAAVHEETMHVYALARDSAKARCLYDVVTDAMGVPGTPRLSRLLSDASSRAGVGGSAARQPLLLKPRGAPARD